MGRIGESIVTERGNGQRNIDVCQRRIGKSGTVEPGTVEDNVGANSLFDDRSDHSTAVITCGRHLQNLDESSGLNKHLDQLRIQTAQQRTDINLKSDEWLDAQSAYGLSYFKDPWNWFDMFIVGISLFSGLSFMSAFRAMRVLRVLKSLKALRGTKLIGSVRHLQVIIVAIVKSIPSIMWTGILLILIYYIFALIGVNLFGEAFPDWFGNIGKAMYTLFQVMTLESWSMGISRPVMEVFPYAWAYFVPFVLLSSFVVMNVVVGIVVNAISEVTAENNAENAEELVASPSALISLIEQDAGVSPRWKT